MIFVKNHNTDSFNLFQRMNIFYFQNWGRQKTLHFIIYRQVRIIMKSDADLKQELYTDQIIPIYLLEDKLRANFVSIQRRFRQMDERNILHQKRVSALEKSKMQSITTQIQKIVTSKLQDLNQNMDHAVFRKQIHEEIENKFKQLRLQLPSQVRRQSQSLISTQLISFKRAILDSRQHNTKSAEEHINFQRKTGQYEEQRILKMIQQLNSQIQNIKQKNNRLQTQMKESQISIQTQIKKVISCLEPSTKPYRPLPFVTSTLNNETISQDKVSQINFVSYIQFKNEVRKVKENMSKLVSQINTFSKQSEIAGQIHSLILKINNNIDSTQKQCQNLKSSVVKKEQVENIFIRSTNAFQKVLKERDDIIAIKLQMLEKQKNSRTTQKQIGEINERIIQLQRLNNYQQHMDNVQKILDKHHLEQPESPKKTLYMDYINHLEKKVDALSSNFKSLNQKINIEIQGTQLMEVSKIDIEEIWKAIMILETIIQNKSDLQSSRKKLLSHDKAYDSLKQDNRTPIKGAQTVYIRRSDTHRAGGFGQKVSSSKNIRHLLDDKPEKLDRNKDKRQANIIKLPEILQQSKQQQIKL